MISNPAVRLQGQLSATLVSTHDQAEGVVNPESGDCALFYQYIINTYHHHLSSLIDTSLKMLKGALIGTWRRGFIQAIPWVRYLFLSLYHALLIVWKRHFLLRLVWCVLWRRWDLWYSESVYFWACMRVCVYACVHVHSCVYVCACVLHACMSACLRECVCVYVRQHS